MFHNRKPSNRKSDRREAHNLSGVSGGVGNDFSGTGLCNPRCGAVRTPHENTEIENILKIQEKAPHARLQREVKADLSEGILPCNGTADKMGDNCLQTTKILTVQEVAETLRVHRATVSRLALSGELKSYLIGNRRLFKEEDVWLFFENQVDRRYVLGKEA